MNTHAISKDAAAYLAETPVTVRRNLLDAMEIYRNEDAVMREKAIEAIAEHRAAFWTISSYNDAIASALPFALNAGVDITTAIENAYERRPDTKAGALDTIVPLNRKAVNALALAYAKAGSFRDDCELEMRAKRDPRPRPNRSGLLSYGEYLDRKGVA